MAVVCSVCFGLAAFAAGVCLKHTLPLLPLHVQWKEKSAELGAAVGSTMAGQRGIAGVCGLLESQNH